jgi:hypothetical protein
MKQKYPKLFKTRANEKNKVKITQYLSNLTQVYRVVNFGILLVCRDHSRIQGSAEQIKLRTSGPNDIIVKYQLGSHERIF